MKKRNVKIAVLLALFGISLQKSQVPSVQAKTLGTYKIKVINPNKNYGIYSSMSSRGPSGWLTNTKTLKYAHYQATTSRKAGGYRYWYVYIDGHKAGWVN